MKQSLLRNLRRKLLEEGKLLRYLSYALGEVVLIIVGILFALKINDWNEDRKAQTRFVVYVAQLKADVRKAIENQEQSIESNASTQQSQAYVLTFLGLTDYGPEELEQFEKGLIRLGNYSEPQVFVGLLGQLLNGDMNTIARDPDLAQKALAMESEVKSGLATSSHLYSVLDSASDRLNQFRGKGSRVVGEPPLYDLDILRASREFSYTTQTVKNRMVTLDKEFRLMKEELEAFLTVLEEYDNP